MEQLPPSGTRRRPTMRDVAERAGVSFKTVSRVVNGEPGVSPALVARVRKAVQELDFRPNPGARVLRRTDRRTASIALLLEDVGNPFSAALARAVENEAVPRGVMVFSASLDEDPQRERELVEEFCGRHADGLLIVPAGDDQSYLAAELRRGTAVVCADRPPRGIELDSVVTTNAVGAREAVCHLGAAGHRRIAFLGDRPTIDTARRRFEGYRDGLESLGLSFALRLVCHDLRDSAAADGAATALLSGPEPPTALFTAQNLVTVGAVRALRRLGLEHRVAVVGFDDFLLADMLSPGVTVVAQDPSAIGRIAAGLLFARIGGDRGPAQSRLVPTTLIRRGSGEIPLAPGG